MPKLIGMVGGTGPQGQGLALRWGMAGEPVIIGSRQQKMAQNIAKILNRNFKEDLIIPMTNKTCFQEADIILFLTPFNHIAKTIEPLIKYLTGEKIIVDVTVPLKPFLSV